MISYPLANAVRRDNREVSGYAIKEEEVESTLIVNYIRFIMHS